MYESIYYKRLKETREKQGYTQEEVALETGIPQTTISRIEKGRRQPSIENLCILIDFYEVSANWILGTGKNTE